ncbi:MAG: prepilin-type N-terminal cleavage/methylation domain-containing protein [Candidatus Pacebacteria bacterium]|nr:prepilin-type N-terminal cleavage/methylation domain-containing protein [Candidatus Paceibacterota bacterium]MBP9843185.1 prepilin-type N-terminal cleavage/methylation domain-containing protein [Candidatus Paceibacterota bacterium]
MNARGFTLVEIIVVVSVIAILSSLLVVGMTEAGQRSRDSDRQANLRLVQNALELYKNKYGRYPNGCNGVNVWSAETVSATSPNRCSSGQEYIVGLAPEFIPTLPKDLRPNGVNSGYMYYVNTEGSAFKFVSYKTVESEVVNNNTHPFKACDMTTCSSVRFNSNNPAPRCDDGDTYAVWGGYPFEPFALGHPRGDEQRDNVICRIP